MPLVISLITTLWLIALSIIACGCLIIEYLLMLKLMLLALKIFLSKRNIVLSPITLVVLRQSIINFFNLIFSIMLSKNQRADYKQARGLAKLFSVKVEIRVFGKLIWSYCFPPEAESEACYE